MSALAAAIKKVATGPHLSQPLTVEEAEAAMAEALSEQADPVQSAIFMIALRMKRETHEENLGVYQALQAATIQQQIDLPHLLLLADPFNGFNRHCPIHAFLPAVLAAAGLPTLSQGVWMMGPKFGVTHAQVLSLAGVDVSLSTEQADDRLTQPDQSWAYLDQAQATPNLFALQDLRSRMIKRPCLATLEKLVLPIRATGQNYLQIGFVHKAYPEVLANMASAAGFDSALLVRGIEGGVIPTLREVAHCFRALDGEAQVCDIDPTQFGITQTTRGVLPIDNETVTVEETLTLGLQALNGQSGPALDSLIYGAAMALWHCGQYAEPTTAADAVRKVIGSGRAKANFEQAIS